MLITAFLSGCLGGASEKTEQTIKTDDGEVKVKTETETEGDTTKIEQTITSEEGDEKIKTETHVEGDTTTFVQTVETEEGTQTHEVTSVAGADSWCQEGGEWHMTSTGAPIQGEVGTANARIKKIVTSGRYRGLCHVIYEAKTTEGKMKVDYYFDESGKNGYMVMDIGGQKMEQEWHG
jgi:hypothetical protein